MPLFGESKKMKSAKFYNEIAGFYDKMIDFEKNLELRINAYERIFPVPGKCADIGCGVGLDSIALAKNGHDVQAFDISAEMVSEAKLNAAKYGVTYKAQVASFATIGKKEKYNYVVSVGNTIAHLSPVELEKGLKKIYSILLPGGKLFLHILNYSLILRESKRINNIAVRDSQVIIRFYDLDKEKIGFNILTFDTGRPREFKLVQTVHYPHTASEIGQLLKKAGFGEIKLSSDFAGRAFSVRNSKDLFIEAYKK